MIFKFTLKYEKVTKVELTDLDNVPDPEEGNPFLGHLEHYHLYNFEHQTGYFDYNLYNKVKVHKNTRDEFILLFKQINNAIKVKIISEYTEKL